MAVLLGYGFWNMSHVFDRQIFHRNCRFFKNFVEKSELRDISDGIREFVRITQTSKLKSPNYKKSELTRFDCISVEGEGWPKSGKYW